MQQRALAIILRIVQMPEMWDDKDYVDITAILDILRAEGYYAKSTVSKDCLYSIERKVELIQAIAHELCKKRIPVPKPIMNT